MRFAATTFRPAFGRVLAVFGWAIAASGLGGFVATADWAGLIRYGWGLALLAALGTYVFWLPSLSVHSASVDVRNVFVTWIVPWAAIERVDTKYALTLYTSRRRIVAWASPAPSRYASQVGGTRDVRLAASAAGGSPRPGDLVGSASGAAALVIRRQLEDLREDGAMGDVPLRDAQVLGDQMVTKRVHWGTIIVLGALLGATVIGIAL